MEKSEIALRNMLERLESFYREGVPGAAYAGEIIRQWDRERGECLAVFPSCGDSYPEPISKGKSITIEVTIPDETILELLKKSDILLADLIKTPKAV